MTNDIPKLGRPFSIINATQKVWYDSLAALSELSKFERFWRIFWILGPFILLIERSPADAWISLICIGFIVRTIKLKQITFLSIFWVRAAFVFWLVCLISAAFSKIPLYSLTEAFIWFRFPLFAMACVYWLGVDKRLIYAMLSTTTIALLIMCVILLAELYFIGQVNGRLSWPYGDMTSGNYIAKVGLPAFLVMAALAVSGHRNISNIATLLSMVVLIFCILTGERMNVILITCAGLLASLMWQPKWKKCFILAITVLMAFILLFQINQDIGERFLVKFKNQLPTHSESPYYQAMVPGIVAFKQAPILGVGTGTFRELCPAIIKEKEGLDLVCLHLRCHPHPHNFYIQMAGETGIIGLITGTAFFISIIFFCYEARKQNPNNVFVAVAFIIPFSLFWPVTSSSDLFGQWNNCFMWSAISLSLCSSNIGLEKAISKKD